MNDQKDISHVVKLLSDARELLRHQGEKNWIRGIDAALTEVHNDLSEAGFERARSIYKTMTEGGRGFSEYYIWKENEDERIAENRKIDELRSAIWNEFFGLR